MIQLNSSRGAARALIEALNGEDEAQQQSAFETFVDSIASDVASEYRKAVASGDANALQSRGFRVLTSEETEYYEKIIEALGDPNPTQAFANIPDDAMPRTIIEDVLKDLKTERPLLELIDPQYTTYITEWILNSHTAQQFAWGEINSEIAKEITSSFKAIEIKQSKLSAFACVKRDMLKLGPTWLDGYVRACLFEAWGAGMEHGIIAGSGVNGEPIGMRKDIHSGVSVDTETGYPDKQAIAVDNFGPVAYGALVAQLVTDESGKQKNIDLVNGDSLALVCNNTTYLTKVMPAVRYLTDAGYRDAFPVATKVVTCNALENDEAILCLAGEYGLFVGGDRGIENSDEFAFLADNRYFKLVTYAYGRAEDNTSAILLDLTGLNPLESIPKPVNVSGTVTTTAAADDSSDLASA